MMYHKTDNREVTYLRIVTLVHAASFKNYVFIKLTLFTNLEK